MHTYMHTQATGWHQAHVLHTYIYMCIYTCIHTQATGWHETYVLPVSSIAVRDRYVCMCVYMYNECVCAYVCVYYEFMCVCMYVL